MSMWPVAYILVSALLLEEGHLHQEVGLGVEYADVVAEEEAAVLVPAVVLPPVILAAAVLPGVVMDFADLAAVVLPAVV